ncbi:MAG: hypothetical protein HQM10_24810 [Candidatus Riflebacteria bacterium]|nr:hypothetical protein [Candidatus Riflebacteria bacterium]
MNLKTLYFFALALCLALTSLTAVQAAPNPTGAYLNELSAPLEIKTEINGEKTFVDWEGYKPYYYGEYVGAPIPQETLNPQESNFIKAGIIGVSYNEEKHDFALVIVEVNVFKAATGYVSESACRSVFPQFGRELKADESDSSLKLVSKAPKFSLTQAVGSTFFNLNKRTQTGSLQRKSYTGGSLMSKCFHEESFNFRAQPVPATGR